MDNDCMRAFNKIKASQKIARKIQFIEGAQLLFLFL